jgi:hypothetical protein
MIDFKIDDKGDICLSEQEKISPFKVSFVTAERPKLRITFNTRTKQRSKKSNRLSISFKTNFDRRNDYKKVDAVRNNEEKAQSIAIRLKTELNELQNFFNDFGSELNRLKHTDLLNTKNHSRIIEYVESAIRDIVSSNDVKISIDRLVENTGNFGLETLKISIFDDNGEIIYTHTI